MKSIKSEIERKVNLVNENIGNFGLVCIGQGAIRSFSYYFQWKYVNQ